MLTGEDVNSHDFLNNDKYHENVAASFLSKYFPEEVTYPIKMHVIAKRYLCSVQSNYYDGVSGQFSIVTLSSYRFANPPFLKLIFVSPSGPMEVHSGYLAG